MTKKLFHLIVTTLLVPIFIISCCVIPEFVQQDCITYVNNTTTISDINCEVAILDGGRKEKNIDVFLSFYADTITTIDVDKWNIFCNDKESKIKQLKIKKNNKWQRIKKSDVCGRILLIISLSEIVHSGDRISLIENFNINQNTERIDISITIPGASEVHFVPCSQEELMYNLKNDNGNIIIALPNDILKTPIVTEEVTRIENIKWDEIVMNKILKNQKYRTITDNIKEEARKIVSDLSIDYRNKVEDKANRGITSYLAIIEQDKEGKYILKSILQYDYLGLEISYNPKYNNHPQKLQLNK